jgi:hypothetical protein
MASYPPLMPSSSSKEYQNTSTSSNSNQHNRDEHAKAIDVGGIGTRRFLLALLLTTRSFYLCCLDVEKV